MSNSKKSQPSPFRPCECGTCIECITVREMKPGLMSLVDFEAGMSDDEAIEALRRLNLFPRLVEALEDVVEAGLIDYNSTPGLAARVKRVLKEARGEK